jgi:hypothetical protein
MWNYYCLTCSITHNSHIEIYNFQSALVPCWDCAYKLKIFKSQGKDSGNRIFSYIYWWTDMFMKEANNLKYLQYEQVTILNARLFLFNFVNSRQTYKILLSKNYVFHFFCNVRSKRFSLWQIFSELGLIIHQTPADIYVSLNSK